MAVVEVVGGTGQRVDLVNCVISLVGVISLLRHSMFNISFLTLKECNLADDGISMKIIKI